MFREMCIGCDMELVCLEKCIGCVELVCLEKCVSVVRWR